MPTAEGRSSLATPISKAATIALGIPLTEAAAAASRISYPPGERACCTASRLTKLRHCSDGRRRPMTACEVENIIASLTFYCAFLPYLAISFPPCAKTLQGRFQSYVPGKWG